ncbi:MAG: hypothetical protein ABDH25_07840 [Dictyoglomaceae bacterium]
MPFCISYTLYRDFPRVDVFIEMENKSKDHRLRFGIVEHPTKLENNKDYVEENVSRYAMESFVSLIDRKSKIMIVTIGLHEYETEVREGKTSLKITLLIAGPYISIPEAQC